MLYWSIFQNFMLLANDQIIILIATFFLLLLKYKMNRYFINIGGSNANPYVTRNNDYTIKFVFPEKIKFRRCTLRQFSM